MVEWFMNGLLFRKVLAMSLVGSYCILLVLFARLLLLKCRRRYVCYLWMAAFLNFVMPFHLQGRFSLIPRQLAAFSGLATAELSGSAGGTLRESSSSSGDRRQGQQDTKGMPFTGEEHSLLEGGGFAAYGAVKKEGAAVANSSEQYEILQKEESAASSIQYGILWRLVDIYGNRLQILWLMGLFGMTLFHFVHIIRIRQQITRDNWMYWDSKQRIAEVSGLSAPFLWGIFRPIIVLPAGIGEAERSYIVAHENCHRRRKDPLVKAAVFMVVATYWFHPVVWAAWFLFCQDMEIACDEAALVDADGDTKKQYAQSLLKYAAAQNGYLLTPLTFGEPSVKARIKNVLHFQKQGVRMTWMARCAVLFVLLGLAVRPAAAKEVSGGTNSEAESVLAPSVQGEAEGVSMVSVQNKETTEQEYTAVQIDEKSRKKETQSEDEGFAGKLGTGKIRHRDGYVKAQVTHVVTENDLQPFFTPGLHTEKELDAFAQKALRDLYDLTGYQVEACVYGCIDLGCFYFAKTAEDLEHSRIFYSRQYNVQDGFHDYENTIASMTISSAGRVWYSDVQQLDVPVQVEKMTDGELAIWFLQHSAVYQGEPIVSAEPSQLRSEITNVITPDGSFYELTVDRQFQAVADIYGPYPRGFVH